MNFWNSIKLGIVTLFGIGFIIAIIENFLFAAIILEFVILIVGVHTFNDVIKRKRRKETKNEKKK